MASPRFDPTINLGHVALIVTWLIGGTAAYFDAVGRTKTAELRITILEARADSASIFQQEIFNALSDIKQDIAVLKAHDGDNRR